MDKQTVVSNERRRCRGILALRGPAAIEARAIREGWTADQTRQAIADDAQERARVERMVAGARFAQTSRQIGV